MPNETIDELKIGLSIDWSKAEKEAQSRGLAIGKSIADGIDKATKYRLNKTSRKANRPDGIHWASYLSGRMGAHPRLNTGGSFFERIIGGAAGNSNVSFFSRGGQTRFGEFAGALQDRLSGLASIAPDLFGNAVAKAKEFAGALRPIGGFVVKQIRKPFDSVAASIKAAHDRVERFRKSIARIVLYRTIRGLMSEVKKAVQEGIQNLYQYSQTIGTTFHESLDTIASSALFIKNAFAAMVAPLVNQVAPVVRSIAEYIGEAANRMAEFFTLITKGAGTQYTRAIWYTKKYAEAAKNAKKSLDLLGIDEINRLTDKSGSGTEDDPSLMFEEAIAGADIGDVGANFAKQIADNIASGDWESVGSVIATKLNEILDKVKNSGLGEKVGGYINSALKAAHGFIDTFSFSEVSATIVKLLQDLHINWEDVGAVWAAKWTIIGDLAIGAFENVNWGRVGEALGGFFKGALDRLTLWIESHDWASLSRDLFNKIGEFITGVDWKGLETSLGEFFKAMLKGAAQIVKGAFESLIMDAFYVKKDGLADKILTWFNIPHSTSGGGWSSTVNTARLAQDSITGGGFAGTKVYDDNARHLALLAELDKYAAGGYPSTGDLFIANERGPELVGTMNGRTYVGSNQDINSVGMGIENAVYAMANMVVQAIDRKDTSVNLDGQKVSKAVTNRQNLASLARG